MAYFYISILELKVNSSNFDENFGIFNIDSVHKMISNPAPNFGVKTKDFTENQGDVENEDLISDGEQGSTSGTPLVCSFPGCLKEFSSRWSLKRHTCSHTGEKHFECQSCGKQFVQKCSLRRHEQTHSENKDWICDHINCGKKFKLKEYLDVHKRTHIKSEHENLVNIPEYGRQYSEHNSSGLCDQLRQRLVRMHCKHTADIQLHNRREKALMDKIKEYALGFQEAMTLLTAVAPDSRPAHLLTLMDFDIDSLDSDAAAEQPSAQVSGSKRVRQL